MPDKKLSVVILTKNEEDKITRCIESVKWVDEVLVIDDESSDATRDIAEGLGARVIRRALNSDFAAQRNFGMSKAGHDWVLQMDADEIVTSELRRAIENTLGRLHQFSAFKMRRKEFFLGHFMRHGGWHIEELKLFKKDCCKYVHPIHERPQVSGNIGVIGADIEHRPFLSISQFIQRQNRYTDLESQDLFKKEGLVKDKIIRYNLLFRPIKIFWKLYIRKSGYRDGFYGLIYAFLNSFRHFLRWAKYWEILKNRGIKAEKA